jgi:hypothetical protein
MIHHWPPTHPVTDALKDVVAHHRQRVVDGRPPTTLPSRPSPTDRCRRQVAETAAPQATLDTHLVGHASRVPGGRADRISRERTK